MGALCHPWNNTKSFKYLCFGPLIRKFNQVLTTGPAPILQIVELPQKVNRISLPRCKEMNQL